jgi:hypothetical protein
VGCGRAWIGTILSINVIEQAGGRELDSKDVTDVNATGPQPARRRSHWPWAVTVLLGIVGVVSALVRNRRQSSKPERIGLRPDDQLVLRYREEVAAGRSPTGNGVVRAHHRPGADD